MSLLLGSLLQVLPRHVLLAQVARHGPQAAGQRCVPFFSGRVALAALAASPALVPGVALVPAYLCNVVPMALQRAGWRVVGYAVGDDFAPDPAGLQRLAEAEGATLLLLAPLYGGDGGLRWWLGDSGRAARQRLGLALVIDACQDAAWLAELQAPGPRSAVLVSFNDKSFPGMMGAALWTDLPLAAPPAPPWRSTLGLWARLLRRLLPRAAGRAHDDSAPAFDFSQATRFPYAFDVAGAHRVQLALGALGLAWLPRWQARRRAAVTRGAVRPVALARSDASPFVIAGADDPGRHRRKPPYALADDASRSLRPGLVVRHNKGFDDR